MCLSSQFQRVSHRSSQAWVRSSRVLQAFADSLLTYGGQIQSLEFTEKVFSKKHAFFVILAFLLLKPEKNLAEAKMFFILGKQPGENVLMFIAF